MRGFPVSKSSVAVYVAFMALAVLTLPDTLWGITPGIDISWIIGLHLAADNGLVFGRDILFTYGPLGFLMFPLLINPWLWALSVIFRDVTHIAFFMSLAAFSLHSENRMFNAVIIGVLAPAIEPFLLIGTFVYELGVAFVLTFYLFTRNGKRNYLTLLAILAGISFYVKADLGLLSFSLTLVATAWTYFKDRSWKSFLPAAAYVVSLVGVGFLFTGSPRILVSFILGCEQIAVGYEIAMSYVLVPSWVILFPLVTSLIILAFVMAGSAGRTRLFFLLSIPFLFITYKEGFVREDVAHLLIFLASWSMFCLLFQATTVRSSWRRGKIVAMFLALILLGSAIGVSFVSQGESINGVALLRNMSPYILTNYGPPRLQSVAQNLELMTDPSRAESIFNETVGATRLFGPYVLSNMTLALLRGHTVDVLPWDVSLVYAYGLQWDPAPVFQSYASYTPYLDEVNAQHYLNQNPPDFVLYRPLSIDGRYPLFDEPLALMALTCNYKLVGNDTQFLLLQRRSNSLCGTFDLKSAQESTFGQQIQVPFSEDTPIIARVFLESSWLGLISDIIYQVPKVEVNLEFSNGQSRNYSLVVATAADGLLLSPGFLSDSIPIPSINRMTFSTNGPEAYKPTIRIEFYKILKGESSDPNNNSETTFVKHGYASDERLVATIRLRDLLNDASNVILSKPR